VHELREEIHAGVNVVGLEPSCVATFRDELTNLLSENEDARRLSKQTYLLSEFIDQKMPDVQLPQLHRPALVHGHCHHHAIMKMTAEKRVLSRMGVDFELLDSGCCGMAGAFGFEKEHYEVSISCGERVLLPRVREADPDTLVVANGFSCREQIAQTTNRRALHLAELLELAEKERIKGSYPEFTHLPPRLRGSKPSESLVAIGAGLLAAGATALWFTRNRARAEHSCPQRRRDTHESKNARAGRRYAARVDLRNR
jgi:hypothetical protein